MICPEPLKEYPAHHYEGLEGTLKAQLDLMVCNGAFDGQCWIEAYLKLKFTWGMTVQLCRGMG